MVLSFPTTVNHPRLETPMAMVGGPRRTVTEVTEALGHSSSQSCPWDLLGRIIAGTGDYHSKALQAGVFLGRGHASPGGGLLHRGGWATRESQTGMEVVGP